MMTMRERQQLQNKRDMAEIARYERQADLVFWVIVATLAAVVGVAVVWF